MTRQEIEAFLAVVRCGSISQAAEKLYVTQPALSRRIQVLEEELGYSLVERRRGSRAMHLTREGTAFIPIAQKSQQLWNEAEALPALMDKKTLRLAAAGSVSTYLMPNVLSDYLARHPEVNLQFINCHSEEGYSYVENGEADVALVHPEQYSAIAETKPAYREPMVCVTHDRAGFPDKIGAAELIPEREIRMLWSPDYDLWHEKYFPLYAEPKVRLGSMLVMENFIEGGNWVIMPLSAARRLHRTDVTVTRLKNPPPDNIVYYLVRRGESTEAIRWFLQCLHREVSGIEGMTSYLKDM